MPSASPLRLQPPRKPVIGLIGGIGSGKSLVARCLAQFGCAVIDADALAREALQSLDVRRQLTAWWGPDVLDGEGRVDREAVAARVFEDESQLRRLEGLIHPKVHQQRQHLRAQHQADPSVVAIVEDCPLLIEAGLDGACDAIIFVRASRPVRLRRVAEDRGWSPEELARREKRQAPLDIKARRADYVIDNDAGVDQCCAQARRVLSQITQQGVPQDA